MSRRICERFQVLSQSFHDVSSRAVADRRRRRAVRDGWEVNLGVVRSAPSALHHTLLVASKDRSSWE